MKKIFLLLVSASLLLTVACGGNTTITTIATDTVKKPETAAAGSAKEPIKLRIAWWGGQSRHDYTFKVIELYQKQNPNVKIEAEYAAFDDYWKRLAPQAAANDLPDIISMDLSYLSQFAEKKQLEELTLYTQNHTIDVGSVAANTLNSGRYDGKLYQITVGVNALGATLDPEIVSRAGVTMPSKEWTWDDLEVLGKQLKASGRLLGDYMRYDVFFPYYLRSIDQKLFDPNGASLGYADDKAFIDYYKRYQKMYDAGYFLSLEKLALKKFTPEDDEMVLGNALSSFAWSNQYVAWSAAAKRPTELLPPPGPNSKKGLFLKASMGLSITKNSKQKEESAKFINFFINDIEANKLIKGERGVPISSKVKEALKPLLNPEEIKVFDYVAWAEANSSPADAPNPIGSIEVGKLLKDISEQILYKRISIEDAAVKFRHEANAILDKNKK
ncbi:multiple sugar transport system substrate-binding protein [Paenibacillus sp. 1_12]|uniref:ABC transporter substrate-binding protein n=1 Tax=Paenibacillus sp. 1_12 TaxID=1566278 RepID=UPI0008EBAE0A|nr:ABC transporter substrate-binding protein [Paenibacillus sp. 1_12]SFK67282.1 multiple sugar transport system substrate-binding protein [Paenibacillus sp. 1_12]